MFRPCNPGPVLEALAEELCVSVEELRGPSRKRTVTNSRAVVHWVFVHLGFSTTEVGDIMHKDHSSVVQAVKKVNRLREESSGWRLVAGVCLERAQQVIAKEKNRE